MKDLPQELIDGIIDWLHPSTSTLLQTALVHPTWTGHSQKLLLNHVSLRPPLPSTTSLAPTSSSSSKATKLLRTLQSSPILTQHITHLALCEGSPLNSTTWLTTDRSIVPLLRLIASKGQHHLRKVELTATYVHYWDLLPAVYVDALMEMMRGGQVECVRVHSWVFRDFKSLGGLVGCIRKGGTLSVSSVTICGGWPDDGGEEDEDEEEDSDANTADDDEDEQGLQVLTLDFVTFPHMHEWLARSLPRPRSLSSSRSIRPAGSLSLHTLRQLRIAQFQTHDPHVLQDILTHLPLLEYLHFKPGSWRGAYSLFLPFLSLFKWLISNGNKKKRSPRIRLFPQPPFTHPPSHLGRSADGHDVGAECRSIPSEARSRVWWFEIPHFGILCGPEEDAWMGSVGWVDL